jgi:hypothetical protein
VRYIYFIDIHGWAFVRKSFSRVRELTWQSNAELVVHVPIPMILKGRSSVLSVDGWCLLDRIFGSWPTTMRDVPAVYFQLHSKYGLTIKFTYLTRGAISFAGVEVFDTKRFNPVLGKISIRLFSGELVNKSPYLPLCPQENRQV